MAQSNTNFERLRARLRRLSGLDTDPKIIVTGMQKSGTTAIAKLLGIGINRVVSSDPFHRAYEKSGNDYRQTVLSGNREFFSVAQKFSPFFYQPIVKDPDFALFFEEIQTVYPKSQIVFIARNPLDNIRSILNRLGLPGRGCTSVSEVKSIPETWQNILKGRIPKIDGNNYIEILAKRWALYAQIYSRHRNICTLIRYEDFLEDKSNRIQELIRELGYSYVRDVSEHVDVQYQPRGQADVDLREFYDDKSYQSILDITTPSLCLFGYESEVRTDNENDHVADCP